MKKTDDLTFKLIESIIVENENNESRKIYGEAKVNHDLSKWSNVGLLEGIEDVEDRKILSIFFEEALEMMLNDEITTRHNFETFLFPVLRRIYVQKKLISLYNTENVFRIRKNVRFFIYALAADLYAFIHSQSAREMIEKIRAVTFSSMDAEAELVGIYSDAFDISILNLSEAKKILKLKLKNGKKRSI